MVEAIEQLFVPIAVKNNVGGEDAKILKRFNEPSWNNPVVRYVDAKGKDLIPRTDRAWSLSAQLRLMKSALDQAGRSIPAWFNLFHKANTVPTTRAIFAMH